MLNEDNLIQTEFGRDFQSLPASPNWQKPTLCLQPPSHTLCAHVIMPFRDMAFPHEPNEHQSVHPLKCYLRISHWERNRLKSRRKTQAQTRWLSLIGQMTVSFREHYRMEFSLSFYLLRLSYQVWLPVTGDVGPLDIRCVIVLLCCLGWMARISWEVRGPNGSHK